MNARRKSRHRHRRRQRHRQGNRAAFAREGAKVAIADLNLEGADATAAELGVAPSERSASRWMSPTKRRSMPASPRPSPLSGGVDILVSNAGIQTVAPLDQFDFAKWKQLLAIHLDGAFLTTRAALRADVQAGQRRQHHLYGLGPFEGSVRAEGALCHGQAWPDRPRRGRRQGGRRARRPRQCHLPGFVRTPLVDKQIPEQAKELGISEDDVIKNVMLKDTVDGEFTTVEDVAAVALFFAAFEINALTGQSLVVSHGWYMQ